MIEIFNEDCITKLKTLPSGTVDIFICDLPYGQTGCKWDVCINLNELWVEFKRLRKAKSTPFLFFCTTRFGYELIKSNQKWFKYDLVIEKANVVGFLNSHYMPMRRHEMLYVFYEKKPIYNFTQYHTIVKRSNERGKPHQDDIYTRKEQIVLRNTYIPPLPASILKMNNTTSRENIYHPTEKTQDILEWILKYYSNEGDTCLDPTMGSGSTGVACNSLNRNFIGIEKDINYYNIAKSRLSCVI